MLVHHKPMQNWDPYCMPKSICSAHDYVPVKSMSISNIQTQEKEYKDKIVKLTRIRTMQLLDRTSLNIENRFLFKIPRN